MLTIIVDGELEASLRAQAARAGTDPDCFALAALQQSVTSDSQDWTALRAALERYGGTGILPPLLAKETVQAQIEGAFAGDPSWEDFLKALEEERQQANRHELDDLTISRTHVPYAKRS